MLLKLIGLPKMIQVLVQFLKTKTVTFFQIVARFQSNPSTKMRMMKKMKKKRRRRRNLNLERKWMT